MLTPSRRLSGRSLTQLLIGAANSYQENVEDLDYLPLSPRTLGGATSWRLSVVSLDRLLPIAASIDVWNRNEGASDEHKRNFILRCFDSIPPPGVNSHRRLK